MQQFPFFLDINEQFCSCKLRKISRYCFFKNTFQAQPQVTFCINLGTFTHSFQLRGIIQTPHRFQLFFLSGFSFTIHRKVGKGGVYLCDSSLPLPPASETLDSSWVITGESSPLHIASSRTKTGDLGFRSASREPLSYVPYRQAVRP